MKFFLILKASMHISRVSLSVSARLSWPAATCRILKWEYKSRRIESLNLVSFVVIDRFFVMRWSRRARTFSRHMSGRRGLCSRPVAEPCQTPHTQICPELNSQHAIRLSFPLAGSGVCDSGIWISAFDESDSDSDSGYVDEPSDSFSVILCGSCLHKALGLVCSSIA